MRQILQLFKYICIKHKLWIYLYSNNDKLFRSVCFSCLTRLQRVLDNRCYLISENSYSKISNIHISSIVWRIGFIWIAILVSPCHIFESSLSNYAPKSTSLPLVLWIFCNSVMQLTRWCEWFAHHSFFPLSSCHPLDTRPMSSQMIRIWRFLLTTAIKSNASEFNKGVNK